MHIRNVLVHSHNGFFMTFHDPQVWLSLLKSHTENCAWAKLCSVLKYPGIEDRIYWLQITIEKTIEITAIEIVTKRVK